MDIVSFIELPLQIWNPNHDNQVLPHVRRVQLQRLADGSRSAELGAWHLAILDMENALALEAVEVLCEGAAEGAEVVSFDDEGEEGVDFVKGVENAKEVTRVAVGCDGKDISN